MRQIIRVMINLLGGLCVGLAIMLILFAWQLSKGPISLGFLSPYIEEAVNSDGRGFQLRMDDTILTWAGWERALDIRVLNVRVLGPGGSAIGSIPEASFSLSSDALFLGRLAPRTIELFGPKLQVRRTRDGSLDIGFGEGTYQSGKAARRLLSQLLTMPDGAQVPDPMREMSYLTRLDVIGADVTVIDQVLKKSWQVPATDVRLYRDADGIKGTISMVIDVDERQTEIELSGGFRPDLGRLDVVASFSEVSPAAFSSIIRELEPLRAFDLPLKGTVSLSVAVDGNIETVDFDLTGGRGNLVVPAPFSQTIPVEKVALSGNYVGEYGDLSFKELAFEFGPGSHVRLPAPVDHQLPVKSVRFKGRYLNVEERLEIVKLKADLNGPTVSMRATVDGLSAESSLVEIEARTTISGVNVDELAKYWPQSLGTDTQQWVVANMSDGLIHEVQAETRLRWTEGQSLELLTVDGSLVADNLTISYMDQMPKVRGVKSHMKFNEEVFEAFVTSGKSGDLAIKRGRIRITGLDEFDQYANIDLSIAGSVGSKLTYIDHPPLGFAAAIGIDPKNVAGSATTKLKLQFILEHTLTADQIDVSAQSTLRDVSVGNIFLGHGIHGSKMSLKVDRERMKMTGDVFIEKIPARLSWRENFGPKAEFRSRYDLSATISDVEYLSDLGLDLDLFSDDYIKGTVGAEIRFTVFDDVDSQIEVTADVAGASLLAPAFGWQKPKGVAGQANIVIDLEHALVSDIPEFSIAAADLTIKGSAKYSANGTGLKKIEFERIAFGRTVVAGALIPTSDGSWDAGFHGPSFDLAPMWEDILADISNTAAEDNSALPRVSLAVEIDRVWLGPNESVNSVSGTFAHENDIWKTIQLTNILKSGADFKLQVVTDDDGNRTLRMRSTNAGETLKLLGYYENMRGGKLEITGRFDDAVADRPLTGVVSVKDYRVVEAPVLAHVLSIMALTGILEALQGDGLAFNSLKIPFVQRHGAISLTDARASGVSLGFTATGTIYTHADVLDIEGTVVPAYAINSALGHIPVLGDIFIGGEKGSGIFAANLTMTGPREEPKILVNPLSALTPGILRHVFRIFGGANPSMGNPIGEEDQINLK